ncbi:microtubule-binding protein TANGLED [Andrographis paniculata]|uniref:microtubule-binding protein TANGLED n=1 Tax=Andrographis paniculata TaxID=175694 RepID=UPI0021E811E1|nr:microtubule-binding protein TANGLED [Andrographis paniculata]
MVARTPPKQPRRIAVAAPLLSPTLLRETVKKVDKCMARLQELQYTVNGGKKLVSGVSLSPRSTRGYMRTSLHCKQESLRTKTGNYRRSPPGKLPAATTEEWRRMSLPAMLLGETMGEILQASQFARTIVEAVAKPAIDEDPKTPATGARKASTVSGNSSGLRGRRKREKQVVLKEIRSESISNPNAEPPSLRRAKSRIAFKVSSSPAAAQCKKENCRYIANRVSPRNRPWVRKTVLFPNPLFHSSPPPPNVAHRQKLFCKTRSPVIAGGRHQTPHKFLVKSPPAAAGKFQVKIRSPPRFSLLPTTAAASAKKSSSLSSPAPPKKMMRTSFSPSRLASRLVSPLRGGRKASMQPGNIEVAPPPAVAKSGGSGAAWQRRSFSPSRIAERLVSPLKSRKLSSSSSMHMKNEEKAAAAMIAGLKHRPPPLGRSSFSSSFLPRTRRI